MWSGVMHIGSYLGSPGLQWESTCDGMHAEEPVVIKNESYFVNEPCVLIIHDYHTFSQNYWYT